jgi:hypothetical protein
VVVVVIVKLVTVTVVIWTYPSHISGQNTSTYGRYGDSNWQNKGLI